MSAGMIGHQNCGFAVSKAAAPSIATTEHKRIAMLTAHVRTGRTRMEVSVRLSILYDCNLNYEAPEISRTPIPVRFPSYTKPALSEIDGCP